MSTPREDRRAELEHRTRAQLCVLVRRTLIASKHPPERWAKAELVAYVLDHEHPAPTRVLPPGGEVP